MTESLRVGLGYDIHRLETGRRLILGGVEISHEKGLVGHSDADVVLHAVTDALLGAAGLPDIGELFPDTDPAYRGADSRALLQDAFGRVRSLCYTVQNLDIVVHAEAPKLSPFKRPIAESIASTLALDADRVSVKAKTQEGLGAIGAGNAIACTVAVLLARLPSEMCDGR